MRTVADIADAYVAGRRLFRSFNKNCNLVTVAGVGQDLSGQTGNPPAQFYVGSIATATALKRSTNGGLDHGPSMPGYRKFLHKLSNLQCTVAGGIPCVLECFDYLAFYPFLVMDTGTFDLTTDIEIPRYAPGDGIQMMIVEQNPYAGSAQIRITYTNQDGVPGRVTPTVTLNTVANAGTIATQAPAQAGAAGLFMPLQSGDYGVAYPTQLEVLVGDVGVLCIVLVYPIATVPIYDVSVPTDWDLWDQQGYLPEIKDDAYLNFVLRPAGSASGATFYGNLVTVWKEE